MSFENIYLSSSSIAMEAFFKEKRIGYIRNISYRISRNWIPISIMGTADPRAFARGKRAIAGSLVFSLFFSKVIKSIQQESDDGDKMNEQLPPFDIVLTENEYGSVAEMKICGVELMDCGYGVSIDDVVFNHSYTYIAKKIEPWMSKEDNHEGMHYNEYTNRWVWL